ncbi:hypothetical protein CGH72_08410 [Vibrio parahaemolyticus]|nr:hypothetical protein CGI25_22250 [Vibrio parahaemolyticus]TOM57075.1 hypothetical protein CGH75_14820 [Vibrio parahaemolyticus]TOM64805.1 hypothetical protein CGH73_20840 [Vibrio parahaemolyticus]TOM73529.1 hypothetical protein CGH72_08410 [Vibrio parahaemolyticus]TOO83621.1 hypothetical protein CGH29_19285 [Vibrio parahaemolyticus]
MFVTEWLSDWLITMVWRHLWCGILVITEMPKVCPFALKAATWPLIIMEPRLAEQHAARITNKKNRPRSDGSIWSFAYLTNKRT